MQRIIVAGTLEYLHQTAPELVEDHARVLALRLNSPIATDDPRLTEENSPEVRVRMVVQQVEAKNDCARRLPWTPYTYQVASAEVLGPGAFGLRLRLGLGHFADLTLRIPGHYPSESLWCSLKPYLRRIGGLDAPTLQCWLAESLPDSGDALSVERRGDLICFGDSTTLREAMDATGIRQKTPFTELDESNLSTVLENIRGEKT